MKKKILAILAGIFVTSAAFALVACSGETYIEPEKAAGNADLVVATITVKNRKTKRDLFVEKLFYDSDNYLKVPGNINGATFLGYRNETGTEFFDANGKQDDNLIIDKDIVLYADYEYEQCKIVFDANGGELNGDSSFDIEYMDDIPNILPTATKQGKIFKGWEDVNYGLISDENGRTLSNKREFSVEQYTINSTFKCTLIATYDEFKPKVTFDYNNSKYNNTTVEVPYNSFIDLPDDVKDNGRQMIIGWYNLDEGEPGADQLSMTYDKRITKDTTFVAVWDTYREVELVFINGYTEAKIYFMYDGSYTNKMKMKVFSKKDSPFPTANELNKMCGEYSNYSSIEWYLNEDLTGVKIPGTPNSYSTHYVFYGAVY